MSIILGLDVSTAITGMCMIDTSIADHNSSIILLDYVDFKDCDDIWDKVEKISTTFKNLKFKPDEFYLEEHLFGFAAGRSTASTLMTLVRFNGLVSYIGYKTFGMKPKYIPVSRARKLCGIKMQKKTLEGVKVTQKEQVYKWAMEGPLAHIQWPKKARADKPIDAAKDMVDSYVIARAAINLNM